MSGKVGRQTPTQSFILPYKKSRSKEAIALYEESGRSAIKWQQSLLKDIMAINQDGLWTHQKFGYSVPRRNGKNEILVMREMWGLDQNESICHTAHRSTTSRAAWERLRKIYDNAGYDELGRAKKGILPPKKSYRSNKAFGLEAIELTDGGKAFFRTRTTSGGLGEGFDLLVIDEAQEYTATQQAVLIYTVSDSANPQTILCGTPPTTESIGTVFPEMRRRVLLDRIGFDEGWAEWSVEEKPDDLLDPALWYETSPSMGYHLNERKIRAEYNPQNQLDFIIQRLGYWYQYSLKSAISEAEWRQSEVQKAPSLSKDRFFAVKFGKDAANAVLSVASRTADDSAVFVEAIDCRPIRGGVEWILPYLQNPNCAGVIIDGDAGKQMLLDVIRERKIRVKAETATVQEVITANASFEAAIFGGGLCHIDQEPVRNAISNCEHRPIGSSGGFGYKTLDDAYEVCLIEATALAYWKCSESKTKRKQKIQY
ncbi:MAG: terminase [Oscillospiraceae bacterium]|nr:terminase [Oscillospiraceae bacterium]